MKIKTIFASENFRETYLMIGKRKKTVWPITHTHANILLK